MFLLTTTPYSLLPGPYSLPPESGVARYLNRAVNDPFGGPDPPRTLRRVASQSRYEGYLVGLEGDTLVLHAMGPKGRGYHLEVPTGWLTRIELYRGNKRTGAGVAKGAVKGAGVGAAGGAILGFIGSLLSEAFDFFDTYDADIGGNVARGAAAGAATGAVVGAADGVVNGETQWEEIDLDRVRVILCRQQERYCADSAIE